MNKIHLIGRLTAEPELRTTNSGVQVCTFTVAVNRRFNRDETDFFPIVVWREMAVNCSKFLSKGSQVSVVGAVQMRRYDDKDGIKRTAIDVQAEEVEFLSTRSESAGNSQPSNVNSSAKPSATAGLVEIEDDDMPF